MICRALLLLVLTFGATAPAVAAGRPARLVLIATGGTMLAAADLVRQAGATVAGNLVLIELLALGGQDRLAPLGCASLRTY